MRRLGRKFAIVLALGGSGVILALIGAATGEDGLAFVGLALALLGLLGAQAWHRLDALRLHDLSRSKRESHPVTPGSPPQIDEQLYGYRRIAEETEQIVLASTAQLSRRVDSAVSEVSAEVAAILQLTVGPTQGSIIRRNDSIRATQVVDVIATLKSWSARRVLTIGMGLANHWLAREVSAASGQMVAVFDETATGTAGEISRLNTLMESSGIRNSIELSSVRRSVPEVDGAYLEWFDLSEFESASFDAVVIAANSEAERRAALPSLDLLDSRIEANGCVILLDQSDTLDVAQAWETDGRWRALTGRQSITIFTRDS